MGIKILSQTQETIKIIIKTRIKIEISLKNKQKHAKNTSKNLQTCYPPYP